MQLAKTTDKGVVRGRFLTKFDIPGKVLTIIAPDEFEDLARSGKLQPL